MSINPTALGSNNSPDPRIRINTATAKEISTLHGVSSGQAEKIVKYRSEHGPFKGPEDLIAADILQGSNLVRSLGMVQTDWTVWRLCGWSGSVGSSRTACTQLRRNQRWVAQDLQ